VRLMSEAIIGWPLRLAAGGRSPLVRPVIDVTLPGEEVLHDDA